MSENRFAPKAYVATVSQKTERPAKLPHDWVGLSFLERATVSQKTATVSQGRATVSQETTTVSQERATVSQKMTTVSQKQATVSQEFACKSPKRQWKSGLDNRLKTLRDNNTTVVAFQFWIRSS